MTRTYRNLMLLAAALLLSACTSKPIYNPSDKLSSNLDITDLEMQRAIITALAQRNWTVQAVQPGKIQAEITVRKHHAEIDIPYSPTSLQILYRASSNLNYKNGAIHRNYNRWVKNLRVNILRELNIDVFDERLNRLKIEERTTYQDFNDAVQSSIQAGFLDGSVKFYLAGQTTPSDATKIRTQYSSRKTNASNKNESDACLRSLQSALLSLQNSAKQNGANAVVNIISLNQLDAYKDPQKYQCTTGKLMSSVTLRGDLVTFK
ncbi:hypothetical protein [Pseudomonas sp. 5P_3.1_Bac2]|uniref:hypothetical protein n=1 Tax=Pseudomonas sp. 5P_3.1_Bac2 TaxID=2971617 RepID=UPI0021C9A7C1|nr:hypothetical protein [Pseudomonas sp. 5P_3.1_Bac2]MCU1718390.1 hypothetical protein [Pseudomonas sp. 5P_3.1_Bac2]